VRAERRDEIASDLWEQVHDVDQPSAGIEIVARALLGVPADLSWRLERSRLARVPGWLVAGILALLGRFEATGRWIAQRGLPGVTTMAAAVVGIIGALVIVTAPVNNSNATTSALVWWGTLLILGGAGIGVGGRVLERRPRLGGTFVILGSGVAGLLLWPTVIAPIAALALSWRAALRIRRAGRTEPVIARG
jgi:hypothetical protein